VAERRIDSLEGEVANYEVCHEVKYSVAVRHLEKLFVSSNDAHILTARIPCFRKEQN
jgi:hypothetical protein